MSWESEERDRAEARVAELEAEVRAYEAVIVRMGKAMPETTASVGATTTKCQACNGTGWGPPIVRGEGELTTFSQKGCEACVGVGEVAVPRPSDAPNVWHFMPSPGVAACGADYPNMSKTEDPLRVDCKACLRCWPWRRPNEARRRTCENPSTCREGTVFRLVGNGIEARFCVKCDQRYETRAVEEPRSDEPLPGYAPCQKLTDRLEPCAAAAGHLGPCVPSLALPPTLFEGAMAYVNARNNPNSTTEEISLGADMLHAAVEECIRIRLAQRPETALSREKDVFEAGYVAGYAHGADLDQSRDMGGAYAEWRASETGGEG